MSIPWITDFTNWTLPAIDSREAFQADSFSLILSAIGWKWIFLGFPLKIVYNDGSICRRDPNLESKMKSRSTFKKKRKEKKKFK